MRLLTPGFPPTVRSDLHLPPPIVQRGLSLAIFIAALAVATSARAQGTDTLGGRAAYRDGTRAYDVGRYEEAAAKFEEAYRLGGDPRYLFNIGQACFKAGKYDQARIAYESFLRQQPEAANRPLVEQRLAEIARVGERKAAPRVAAPPAFISHAVPAPRSDAAESGSPFYTRWWFWTAVGAVVVASGATAAFLTLGRKDPAPMSTLGSTGPGQ